MTQAAFRARQRAGREIGWREHVGLPLLGVPSVRAKIDTGARTSALHASGLKIFERGGQQWASFDVPVVGEVSAARCQAQIVDQRKIRNTGGRAENRFIIQTMIVLGQRNWVIEISLANRERMNFELILGRTAIRGQRLLVNPGRSFLAGAPASCLPGERLPS